MEGVRVRERGEREEGDGERVRVRERGERERERGVGLERGEGGREG